MYIYTANSSTHIVAHFTILTGRIFGVVQNYDYFRTESLLPLKVDKTVSGARPCAWNLGMKNVQREHVFVVLVQINKWINRLFAGYVLLLSKCDVYLGCYLYCLIFFMYLLCYFLLLSLRNLIYFLECRHSLHSGYRKWKCSDALPPERSSTSWDWKFRNCKSSRFKEFLGLRWGRSRFMSSRWTSSKELWAMPILYE